MLTLRASLRVSRPKWKSLMLNKGYPFSRTVASIMQLHYLLIGALFLLCLSFSGFFFIAMLLALLLTGSKSAWETVLIVLHSAQVMQLISANVSLWTWRTLSFGKTVCPLSGYILNELPKLKVCLFYSSFSTCFHCLRALIWRSASMRMYSSTLSNLAANMAEW